MAKESRIRTLVTTLLRYVVATVSFSIVLYILFALVFSTEEERHLKRENRLYRTRYAQMKQQEALISDVLEGLLEKDDTIYKTLFETEPPSLDAVTAADVIAANDSLSESFYLSAAASASESLMLMAGNVDDNFAEIFRLVQRRRDSIPPLSLPLKGMSYVQTGASIGLKDNPVYKLQLMHEGLDLIAPQGDAVYAAADGTVSEVKHSRKGLGNIVEISHGNGYVTRYCLLGDISATKGRSVKRGQKIGTVGISASFTAPHLHFEVRKGGEVLDPVHFLFASLSPEEYARMIYMAVSTSQSLD